VPYINVPGGGGSSSGAGREIGYDPITANVTITAGSEATGTVVITCAAHVFDGAAVLATFFAPLTTTAANYVMIISLFEGATQISRFMNVGDPVNSQNPVTGMLRFTPAAGSHTYTVTAFRFAGNAVVFAGSGGTAGYPPAFIRFTKV
jgi:hypothetical protein